MNTRILIKFTFVFLSLNLSNLALSNLALSNLALFNSTLFNPTLLKAEDLKPVEAMVEDDNTKRAHKLESVVVSADALKSNLLQTTTVATVIDNEELNKKQFSTLGETLATEAGVSSSFFGQGASRPVIRGFSGNRVSVLQNGLKTGDVSEISEDHLVTADPMQSNRIEVLRGAKTILYGSSAIGGVVNLIDDAIAETPLTEPFSMDYLTQFGDSADNEKTLGVTAKFKTDNLNWYVSGFNRSTASFEIPGFTESQALFNQEHGADDHGDDHDDHDDHNDHDHDEHEAHEEGPESGRVSNSDTETRGFKIGTSYTSDTGFIGFSVSGLDSDYGVPGHVHLHTEDHDAGHDIHDDHDDHDEEHHDDDDDDDHHDDHQEEFQANDSVRIESKQMRYELRGQEELLDSNLKSVKYKLAYTDYEHKELEGGSLATIFERDSLEARVDLIHNPIANFEGFFGLQMLYDDFFTGGEEAFTQPVKTYSPGVYFFEATPIAENLNIEFGGRIEYVHYDPEFTNTEGFTPFSVSVGTNYSYLEYELGITFSYTERAPQVSELFSDGAHLARQIYELGNSNLNNESAFGAELVLKKNAGLFTGAFTPFIQSFSNYINLDANGEEQLGLPVFAYNEIDATFSGFEFETQFHIDELIGFKRDHLHLGYQLDYVRAYNDSDNLDIPRIPPLRQILSLNYQFSDLVESEIQAIFADSQNNVGAFENPSNSYEILNANLSYKLSKNLSLFLRGTNLTDSEARQHASFLKDTLPLRGRAFLVGISGKI